MTLTQIKRQEMDSQVCGGSAEVAQGRPEWQAADSGAFPLSYQVRVLELESQLQKERQRLGELRKKHYELAGVAEGWDENGKLAITGSSLVSSVGPTLGH